MDLSSNNLVSGLPPFNSTTQPSLASINVSFNALNGPLPAQWGTLSQLTLLAVNSQQAIGAAASKLSGPVFPPGWSALTALAQLHLAANNLTGTIPTQARLDSRMSCVVSLTDL